MNPEEYMIACEEAEKAVEGLDIEADEALRMIYHGRNSFDSVDMGDLIRAGIGFRPHSGEDEATETQEEKLIEQGIFNTSRFEEPFYEQEGFDADTDENDPPLETRGAYWAGPWEKEDEQESKLSKNCRKAAKRMWETINKMEPTELFHKYFGMKIDCWPQEVRTELNKLVGKKLGGLMKKLHKWKKQRLWEIEQGDCIILDPGMHMSNMFHEREAVLEKHTKVMRQLERILLVEPKTEREYAPIIHDQGVEIDKRWTRLEAEREDHIRGETERKASENQSWTHQMWFQDEDGNIKKNMSGEEALFLKRAKNKRDDLFEEGLRWVQQQTSPGKLARALQRMEAKFQRSREKCWRKRNWSEVYLTKKQHRDLRDAFKARAKEMAK